MLTSNPELSVSFSPPLFPSWSSIFSIYAIIYVTLCFSCQLRDQVIEMPIINCSQFGVFCAAGSWGIWGWLLMTNLMIWWLLERCWLGDRIVDKGGWQLNCLDGLILPCKIFQNMNSHQRSSPNWVNSPKSGKLLKHATR